MAVSKLVPETQLTFIFLQGLGQQSTRLRQLSAVRGAGGFLLLWREAADQQEIPSEVLKSIL